MLQLLLLKKYFLNLIMHDIIINFIVIMNVLYTVLNTISNIAYKIFGKSLFKIRGQSNKKSHFFRVTLDNFLEYINSPGGILFNSSRAVMTYLEALNP